MNQDKEIARDIVVAIISKLNPNVVPAPNELHLCGESVAKLFATVHEAVKKEN